MKVEIPYILAFLLVIAACLLVHVSTKTKQETFNRFSNKKVTYWEAAFSDLRVEPQIEDKEKK